MMGLPISACIITKDEETRISDCIKSLYFVNEVIVVDSHSTDKTCEIAKKLGAKVVINDFKGHIEQKNYALTLANNEWIISLDADERVSQNLRKEIEELFDTAVNMSDGYRCPRRTFYIDKWIGHCGWYPDKHLRLFRNSLSKWGGNNPHDRVFLEGSCGELKNDLIHYSFDSLSSHIRTINSFSSIMARNLYREKNTKLIIIKIVFRPLWKFIEMFILKKGFLDGRHGFIISAFSAFATLSKYAKLYELIRLGYDGKYSDKESQ